VIVREHNIYGVSSKDYDYFNTKSHPDLPLR